MNRSCKNMKMSEKNKITNIQDITQSSKQQSTKTDVFSYSISHADVSIMSFRCFMSRSFQTQSYSHEPYINITNTQSDSHMNVNNQ